MPYRTLLDSEISMVYHQTEQAVGPSSCKALNDGYEYTAVALKRREECLNKRTPDYWQRKRTGGLLPFTNYWRYSGKSWTSKTGTATLRFKVGSGSTLCTIDTTKQFAVDCPPLLGDDGLRAAFNGMWPDMAPYTLGALSECVPDLDVGTQVAEMSKTADMAFDVGRNLFDFVGRQVKSLRRGGIRALIRDLSHRNYGKKRGSFADEWLATTYGYGQVIRDFEDMRKAWNQRLINIKRGKADGVSLHTVTDTSRTEYLWGEAPGATVKIDLHREFRMSTLARAAARYFHALPNAYADGYVTLYEMIPYFWMVDWFINIGDALKAANVVRNAHSISVAEGYILTCETTQTCSLDTPAVLPWSNATVSGYEAKALDVLKLRIPVGTPSLVPRFNLNLSGHKLITLASLLEQQRSDVIKTFSRR